MAPLVPARRFAWLLFVCGILLCPRAGFAEQQIFADFDGDGQSDQAILDSADSSTLRVWLSKTGAIRVIKSHRRLLHLVAADLDGDGHPELVAADASSGLQVWKTRAPGKFRVYRPRRGLPKAQRRSQRTFEDDTIPPDDAQPTQCTSAPFDADPPAFTSFTRPQIHAQDVIRRPLPLQRSSPCAPRAPPRVAA